MNKIPLLYAVLSLGLIGCSLDSAMARGESCDLQYVLLNNGKTCQNGEYSEVECSEFRYYFKEKSCPSNFSVCDTDLDGVQFCRTECAENEGFCDNKCMIFNTHEHCGSCDNSCDSSQDCVESGQIDDITGEKQYVCSTIQKGEDCQQQYIDMGNHLSCEKGEYEDPACEEFRRSFDEGYCPARYSKCDTDGKDNTYCHIECPSGQIYCDSNCILPNTLISCGACLQTCGKNQVCELANNQYSCETCPDGTHLDEKHNECVNDTIDKCGVDEVDCNKDGVKSVQCLLGQCVVDECEENYHLIADECRLDSVNACGTDEIDCMSIENAVDQACVAGQCEFNCEAQYHKSGNSCALNNEYSCGNEQADCSESDENATAFACVDGECQSTVCKTGFHLKNNKCVRDTEAECGDVKVHCPASAICYNRQCLMVKITGVSDFTCAQANTSIFNEPGPQDIKEQEVTFEFNTGISEPVNFELSLVDVHTHEPLDGGIKFKETNSTNMTLNFGTKGTKTFHIMSSDCTGNAKQAFYNAGIDITVKPGAKSPDVLAVTKQGYKRFNYYTLGDLTFQVITTVNRRLPAGVYLFDVRGAGGGSTADGSVQSGTGIGGHGGGARGKFLLKRAENVWFYVGGAGGKKQQGFNGGALGHFSSALVYGCGGGGASDIRIGKDDVGYRVVTGGGGGGGMYFVVSSSSNGGNGGGYSNSGSGEGDNGSYKTQMTVQNGDYFTPGGGMEGCRGTKNKNNCPFGTPAANGAYKYAGGGGGGWYSGMSGQDKFVSGAGGSSYIYGFSDPTNYVTAGGKLTKDVIEYLGNGEYLPGADPQTGGSIAVTVLSQDPSASSVEKLI